MLTQKLSIKRHIVVKKYEAQIEELYASGGCARCVGVLGLIQSTD